MHPSNNRFIVRTISIGIATLWMAGCAAPADSPTTAVEKTAVEKPVTAGAAEVATTPGQSSRLIPPTNPATTAAVSNELIVADTVVSQTPEPNANQNVNVATFEANPPTLGAAVPDSALKPAADVAAKKLEQLRILAISGDSDAQLKLGDAYASDPAAVEMIDRTGIDNSEVVSAAGEAYRWYQLAASQGNAVAQYKLGLQYFRGEEIDRDYSMAREWWLESATQGNADAQQMLGYLYSEALGVDRDYNRAISWYTRAGQLGHAEAQTLLGSLYHEGNRVPQNYTEAFKWYKLAAERGHPHAQYTLATLYHDGFGTDPDYVRCIAWVDVALANGYADEFNAREECSRYLDESDLDEAAILAKRLKSGYADKPDFN